MGVSWPQDRLGTVPVCVCGTLRVVNASHSSRLTHTPSPLSGVPFDNSTLHTHLYCLSPPLSSFSHSFPRPSLLPPSLPSFSNPGSVLCGVGRDRHSKTHIVLWNTSTLRPHPGEVTVLAQAHTDISIHTMKIAHFDEKRYTSTNMTGKCTFSSHSLSLAPVCVFLCVARMVSCGRENIRFWRVKGGTLRSCPVSLGSHHHMQFTDVAFQPGYPNGSDIYNRNVLVTSLKIDDVTNNCVCIVYIYLYAQGLCSVVA